MCGKGGGKLVKNKTANSMGSIMDFSSILDSLDLSFFFFSSSCPDPRSFLSLTAVIITTSDSSPAVLYYHTTTFKYICFFPNHQFSLLFSDSLFSPFALYSPLTCNSICPSKVYLTRLYKTIWAPKEEKMQQGHVATAVLIDSGVSQFAQEMMFKL